jgi:hypothetical protein
MSCKKNEKLLPLMEQLKDARYVVYDDNERIGEILSDRRNKVIDLTYNYKEDMCDLFESKMKIRVIKTTSSKPALYDAAFLNISQRYSNLTIFPDKDGPIDVFFAQYFVPYTPYKENGYTMERILRERSATSVIWGDKIYVLVYDKDESFMFEGYLSCHDEDDWDDYHFAHLDPTRDPRFEKST